MKRNARIPLTGDQWLLAFMMSLIFILGAIGLYVIATSDAAISVSVIPLVTLIATLLGNLAAKPSFPVTVIPVSAPGATGEPGEKGATGETGATPEGEPAPADPNALHAGDIVKLEAPTPPNDKGATP